MRILAILSLVYGLIFCSVCLASPQQNDRVLVAVETEDGTVAWSKIAAAVAAEVGEDVPLLAQIPSGEIDINAASTRLLLYSANKMLLPLFRISINRDNDTVVVRVDKTEIAAARKRWAEEARARAHAADLAAGRQFGLRPFRSDASLEEADHIVLLVHGFNSSTDPMAALAKQIESTFRKSESRVEVATFDYATRDGIPAAAATLEKELLAITEQNPECSISLVTHSMGGIVSRFMIESEEFSIPQIERIIMVAPPNHGTQLAALPWASGSFDSILGQIDRAGIRQALQLLVTDANLAIEDLQPDSALLKTLNAGQRNAAVDYSIILGDVGILSSADRKFLQQLTTRLQNSQQAEMVQAGQQLGSLLKLVSDELVTKQGDGVVSVASGKLQGVADTIVLGFQHSDLLKADAKTHRKIIRQILRRLKPLVDEQ